MQSQKHIVLVSANLGSGGAERVLSSLANFLNAQGYRISLVNFEAPKVKSFYPLDDKIKVYNLDLFQKKGMSSVLRLINLMGRIRVLRRKIRVLNPNLVISFVDTVNVITLLSTLGLHIPVIVSERTHPDYGQLPTLYKALRWFIYPNSAQILVQTSSAKEAFPKRLKSRTEIMPNPLKTPPKDFHKKHAPSKTIISLGRLCPFKGYDLLLKAFHKIHADNPEWRIAVYGKGDERKRLEILRDTLGLHQKVTFEGETKESWKALKNADIFAFPSYFEGFPNALAEAMSVGLAVACTDCLGNRDLVQHQKNGLISKVGDVESLAKNLQMLMNDPKLREKLGIEAQKILKTYNEKDVFQKWLSLVKENLNEK